MKAQTALVVLGAGLLLHVPVALVGAFIILAMLTPEQAHGKRARHAR